MSLGLSQDKSTHRIQPHSDGFYTEFLISNTTRFPIVVIDDKNVRVRVEPSAIPMAPSVITVTKRYHNGSRIRRVNKLKTEEIPIRTEVTTIDGWEIESGWKYIETLDVVIANVGVGATMLHPHSRCQYTDALISAVAEVAKTEETTSLKFFLNDPKGRQSMVFAAIGSSIFEIPVTDVADDTEDPTFVILVSSETKTHISTRVLVEELFTRGQYTTEHGETAVSLGLTAQEATTASTENTKRMERRVFEATCQRMDEERKDHQTAIDTLNEQLATITTQSKSKQAEQVTVISGLKTALMTEQAKAAEWQGLYEAQKARDIVILKEEEARAKTIRARSATTNEHIKLAMTVAKIASGLIIGVAIPFLAKKKKK